MAQPQGGVAVNYEVRIGERKAIVSVRPRPDGGYLVSIDGGPERVVRSGALGAAERWLHDDGPRRTLSMHLDGDTLTAQISGHGLHGEVIDPRSRALSESSGASEGTIRTPMPGAVVRVLVSAGMEVKRGQVLVVLEAMKMENEFRSPIDGRVAEVGVVAGTAIDAGTVLAVVAP